MRPAAAVVVVVGALVFGGCGCGIAPIQREPGPPRAYRFVDAHGRPRAWGGGACPLTGPHEHLYPPVPPAAFVDDHGAWRETRALTGFDGPHRWKNGRCTRPTWHQHVVDEELPRTGGL
ncbi:MAG: hypothetical protein Q8O67_24790 [Deltaproteobacteria bacterium]|nr:hypothetical protein [Deltaproteobacteria bacterium]